MVLDEDQKALLESARKFSRERLLPDYQKLRSHDRNQPFNVFHRAVAPAMLSEGQ